MTPIGEHGRALVSTVWLGYNHSSNPAVPGLIFETVIFTNTRSRNWANLERYGTEEEARAGHERAVEHARSQLA
jgi:hypothetical protein